MVFLKREGNKIRYTDLIIPLFPPHTAYVEPFFGTGAIFWKKDSFFNKNDSVEILLTNYPANPQKSLFE